MVTIFTKLDVQEDAIATFNFLNAEGRYVAAGLYPPDDMVLLFERLLASALSGTSSIF